MSGGERSDCHFVTVLGDLSLVAHTWSIRSLMQVVILTRSVGRKWLQVLMESLGTSTVRFHLPKLLT